VTIDRGAIDKRAECSSLQLHFTCHGSIKSGVHQGDPKLGAFE